MKTDPQPTPAPPGESSPSAPLLRSRRIAWLMDEWVRIPGTRIRVGLDPLLGLIPGLGDWISWVASGHLLWAAWRLGGSATLLLRMTGHLIIDGVVGTVPLIGDLFDIGWKANSRNLRLLERVEADPSGVRRESRWLVGGLLGLVAAAGIGSVWLAWWAFRSILGLIGL